MVKGARAYMAYIRNEKYSSKFLLNGVYIPYNALLQYPTMVRFGIILKVRPVKRLTKAKCDISDGSHI